MLTVTLIGSGVPGSSMEQITSATTWGDFKREIGSAINFGGKIAILADDDNDEELADSDALPTEGSVTICLTPTKQKAGLLV